ncbi:RNA-directed DNA polymerase [Senna tora]|uniref:RNA-directed DNA polymerase n=1 Tax=Senna tora TaxID=362788 RepID=A0A834WZX6_9FABA|nr:RNA-directed DNA polymerase [Senna tora]
MVKGDGSRFNVLDNKEGVKIDEMEDIQEENRENDGNMIMDVVNPLFVNQVIENVVKDREGREVWRLVPIAEKIMIRLSKESLGKEGRSGWVEEARCANEGVPPKALDLDKEIRRGVASKIFPQLVRDMQKLNSINLMSIYEPRISGEKAKKVIKKLGWNNHFMVDARGFSKAKGKVEERIDRFLCNNQWQNMFKDAKVFHPFFGK